MALDPSAFEQLPTPPFTALSINLNFFNFSYKKKLYHSIELVTLILTHIIFLKFDQFKSMLRAFKVGQEPVDGTVFPGVRAASDTPFTALFFKI